MTSPNCVDELEKKIAKEKTNLACISTGTAFRGLVIILFCEENRQI